MGNLFGTDGIRGIVGENLTVELAFHSVVTLRMSWYAPPDTGVSDL